MAEQYSDKWPADPDAALELAVRSALISLPAFAYQIAERKRTHELSIKETQLILLVFRSLAATSGKKSDYTRRFLAEAAHRSVMEVAKSGDYTAFSAVYATAAATAERPADVRRYAGAAAANSFSANIAISSDPKAFIEEFQYRFVEFIETNKSWPTTINHQPLFFAPPPEACVQAWRVLARDLRADGEDWGPWLSWYESKLYGKEDKCIAAILDELHLPEGIWDAGPRAVNGHILDRLGKLQDFTERDASSPVRALPDIPPAKPAALEPYIQGDLIKLPSGAARSDLKSSSQTAALKALKKEITDLAGDAATVPNLDQRCVAFLKKLSSKIPSKPPKQEVLFGLAHQTETLEAYARTVNEEWPNMLAAQYHSMVRAYDRTMRQFPRWREFTRNLSYDAIDDEQITEAPDAAHLIVNALRKPDISPHVDTQLIETMEGLSAARPAHEFSLSPLLNKGRAADLLESASNTLKALAFSSIENIKRDLGAIGRSSGDYVVEFRKGFRAQAKQEGEKTGVNLAKWTNRAFLSIAGSALTGAALSLGPWLATTFPHIFGWLTPVMEFVSVHAGRFVH